MFVIRQKKQVAALASPVRQEIVDAVAAAGPCTMAKLGELLGRRADTLYYHVAALAKVGLLVETGRERTGKRFGAVYDVPGRPMRIDYEAAGSEAVTRVVRSAIRLGARDFTRAMANGECVASGETRNLWGGRVKGWVTDKELPEINRLIGRLTELIQRGKPREGARAQSLTYVLTPVAGKKKTDRKRGK
jgi:DNA-binding transcriptional ArsR family regulator